MLGLLGKGGQWAAAAAGLGSAARAAWGGLNPLAKSTIIGAGGGAIAGGAYGAFSDDTSVLGGMLAGGAMGAAGGWAYPTLRGGVQGLLRGSGIRNRFGRAGRNIVDQVRFDGAASSRFIGNTASRTYNGFRALWK